MQKFSYLIGLLAVAIMIFCITIIAQISTIAEVQDNDELLIGNSSVKHIGDGFPEMGLMTYIGMELHSSTSIIRRSGYNGAVGATNELIFPVDQDMEILTGEEKLKIISTDAADDGSPVGNGARTVTITGLDDDYAEISEVMTMNGVGAVETNKKYLRFLHMIVTTVGATGSNEGNISVTNNAGTKTLGFMEIGSNCSLHSGAFYTVPAGYTFYMTSLCIGESNNKDSHWHLFRLTDGKLLKLNFHFELKKELLCVPMELIRRFPEKTTFWISASSVGTAAICSAVFEGYLETNDS